MVAAVEYNKDYYQDRDLKPSEEIFFKITITPFASVNSPSFNKWKKFINNQLYVYF